METNPKRLQRVLLRTAVLSAFIYSRLGKPQRGARAKRGMAMVWAMIVFTVLTVATVDFLDETRVNYALAVNQSDESKAYFNARSGLNLQMMGLLFQNELTNDPTLGRMVRSANLQVWEFMGLILPIFVTGELETAIGSIRTKSHEERFTGPYAQNGEIEFQRPEPEEGKINLNAFASPDINRELVQRFCHMVAPPQFEESLSISESRAVTERFKVIAAIVDYVDPDEDQTLIDENCEVTTGSAGGESMVYRDVDWKAKNMPFTTLGELRLIPLVSAAFLDQFQSKMTVYPIADNALYINQADATVLIGFLCAHIKGVDAGSNFSPCAMPQISYEISRLALALDGYIRFFQNPLNVLMFYLGGMGGLGNDSGRIADGMGSGQMQAFRRPQQLESIVRSIMSNPQFEWFFLSQADTSQLGTPELRQALQNGQMGLLPAFTFNADNFDFSRMARNISTSTPKVFTLTSVGTQRNIRRSIRTVVDVSSAEPQVLYWREY